jgi:hypothetical protein
MGRCEWTERNGAMADRILADSDASGWPALVTGTPRVEPPRRHDRIAAEIGVPGGSYGE